MRSLTLTCLLLGGLLATACGGEDASVYSDLTGKWSASFADGSGTFEIHELGAADLGGTLTIDEFSWTMTGTTDGPRSAVLVILPARYEDVLYDATGLGLPVTTASFAIQKGYRRMHASDRLEFALRTAADYDTASGEVRSFSGKTKAFTLRR